MAGFPVQIYRDLLLNRSGDGHCLTYDGDESICYKAWAAVPTARLKPQHGQAVTR